MQGVFDRAESKLSHAEWTDLGCYAVRFVSKCDCSHSNLPYSEQKKVFQQTPRGFRKVILSTGMAETSISIDGVTSVIDSGFETVQMYSLLFLET